MNEGQRTYVVRLFGSLVYRHIAGYRLGERRSGKSHEAHAELPNA
jgi:hypothetical protein